METRWQIARTFHHRRRAWLAGQCTALMAALFTTLVSTPATRAQVQRLACVAAPGASDADEAICWFARRATDGPACHRDGTDRCLHQALRWCQTAALDMPAAGHTCFLANVAAGNLEAAAGMAEYLQAPPARVARCRAAVTQPIDVSVESDPKGAEVLVEGISHGRAPVTVTLAQPFWKQSIVGRVGGAPLQLKRATILAAFDRSNCTLDKLTLSAPIAESTSAPVVPTDREPGGPPAWMFTGIGMGAAVAATIAFRLIGDGQYENLMALCGTREEKCSDAQIDESGVALSDTLMVTSAILAGSLAITSGILLLSEQDDSGVQVSIGPASVTVRGKL
ncbi:MAG: PEGA domain-containing protein [Myxococcales bacterium]|nr:PEGA domain-containing protein [Myxococcales bacterium]